MALIKCTECHKDMSSSAEACPHCGFKERKTGCLGVIGYLILALIVLGVITRCSFEEGHIAKDKTLPKGGAFTCSNLRVVHSVKSPTATMNDAASKSVEATINITDNALSLDAKVNGFNQSNSWIPYKIDNGILTAKSPVQEKQVLDPSNNKPWISSSYIVITFDIKTGALTRVTRNESLNLDRKLTSYEIFTLTGYCLVK